MITSSSLSDLRNFFGTQFHEDWVEEGGDPDEIVKDYIAGSRLSHQELGNIGQAILDYIQDVKDDAELDERLIDDLYCYYDPQGAGIPAREWLRKVAAMLMDDGQAV